MTILRSRSTGNFYRRISLTLFPSVTNNDLTEIGYSTESITIGQRDTH